MYSSELFFFELLKENLEMPWKSQGGLKEFSFPKIANDRPEANDLSQEHSCLGYRSGPTRYKKSKIKFGCCFDLIGLGTFSTFGLYLMQMNS